MSFDRFASKFSTEAPAPLNSFDVYRDSWRLGFTGLDVDGIRAKTLEDGRPAWCAQFFEGFKGAKVLELGPADGYNTAALEHFGAEVTAIEGNVDAFLRCLILKNALDMRASFELGDFTKAFGQGRQIDILYASGVLYHLVDPIDFLDQASKEADNLFLWTHFYDAEDVAQVGYESEAFAAGRTSTKEYKGKTYTYYEKVYDLGSGPIDVRRTI